MNECRGINRVVANVTSKAARDYRVMAGSLAGLRWHVVLGNRTHGTLQTLFISEPPRDSSHISGAASAATAFLILFLSRADKTLSIVVMLISGQVSAISDFVILHN